MSRSQLHPVTEALNQVEAVLKSVADVNPAFMQPRELATALVAMASVEARTAELRLRMLACADEVAADAGARTAGDWLALRTRQRCSDGRADHRLAQALDRDWLATATALREGRVNVAQARVIVRALEELPDDVPAELVIEAEAELLRLAEEFDPTSLARLGRRILEVVAPDVADQHEAKRLADLERSARERQRLRLRSCGDGTTRISGLLPDDVAARLATCLDAFANPRRDYLTTDQSNQGGNQGNPFVRPGWPHGRDDDRRQRADTKRMPYPRRAAEALAAFLEAVDPARLPLHGGDATTMVVTIDLQTLISDLGTATLGVTAPGDSLDRITADEARRLACNAQIVPAVLGADGEVLDLGRSRRLFSRAQRRALLLQHPTCQAEGCSIPGAWSEAHHWRPWSQGGPTDLANAVLLCSIHHHRAHDPSFATDRLSDGQIRLTRRRR